MIDVAVRIEDEIARRGIKLRRAGRAGAEYYGPCPICQTGVDRFSFNIRKQVWNCRGCADAAGDVIALVQRLDRCDFSTALKTLGVEERPSPAERPTLRPAQAPNRTQNENGARAGELWRAAVPIAGTLAETYLASRGLEYADRNGDVLRFHGRCPFGSGTAHPCMLALFRTICDDKPVAVHRTALTQEGRKIDRMTLGSIGGAAIKFGRDEVDYGLHVGEGVETVLAGMALGFRPAWALGSAGAIRVFPVLDGIDALTILVDHDNPDRNGRQAGHEAARECAERWIAAGREVRSVVPRRLGADMADLLESVV